MPPLLADLPLARRLELSEAHAAASYARALAHRRPAFEVEILAVAGGLAVYAGPGSPLSEVKALGLHGPVTPADLDRMESLFLPRREPCRIVVSPLADPSLILGLADRQYRLARFESILAMPLDGDSEPPPANPAIHVRLIRPDEADLYARLVAPQFVPPGEPIDEMLDLTATMLDIDTAAYFLAYLGEAPVGGGAIFIQDGVALLAGAATLPTHRNLGVHAALHHARLAHARAVGCDLAVQGAEPGSTSHRNAQRRGLHLAYTRAVLVRDPA